VSGRRFSVLDPRGFYSTSGVKLDRNLGIALFLSLRPAIASR
jgi:hypothetical protein